MQLFLSTGLYQIFNYFLALYPREFFINFTFKGYFYRKQSSMPKVILLQLVKNTFTCISIVSVERKTVSFIIYFFKGNVSFYYGNFFFKYYFCLFPLFIFYFKFHVSYTFHHIPSVTYILFYIYFLFLLLSMLQLGYFLLCCLLYYNHSFLTCPLCY